MNSNSSFSENADQNPDDADAAASQQPAEDRYRAPALDKGLDILELLARQPQGLTRAEIVKKMDRNASEIYRMARMEWWAGCT